MPGTHGQLMKKGVNFSGSAEGGGGSDIQEVDYAVFEQKSQEEKDNGTAWFVYNIPSLPDGKAAEPNNVQTWLNCANITDKSYTTVNEVLADTTTLTAIISSNNASDYMARSTTWATTICANQTAMTLIGANNYCADAVLADSDWLNAIADSAYMESVLNVKVPTMTSDTAPSGECFASAGYSSADRNYRAFDNDYATSMALSTSVSENYIGYNFVKPVMVKVMTAIPYYEGTTYYFYSWKFEGSNDGTAWTQLDEVTANTKTDTVVRKLTNTTAYRYYRCHLIRTSRQDSPYYGITRELQFYGREDV